MKDVDTKLVYHFFLVTTVFHVVFGVVVFVLFYIDSNILQHLIVIGLVLSIMNALYWGYHFYRVRGRTLYVLGYVAVIPFIILVSLLIKEFNV